MNLHRKHLSGPVWGRTLSREEQVRLCDQVLSSEKYSVNEKINSVVIAIYKAIELGDYEKAKSYGELGEVYSEKTEKTLNKSKTFEGLRKDSGQLYLSLNTALRHIDIIRNDYSFGRFQRIYNFFLNDEVLSPTYCLNIGQSMLVLGYFLFVHGERDGYLKLTGETYDYMVRVLNNSYSNELPGSSPFRDVLRMGRHIQFLLAGREWILGTRYRDDLLNAERISTITTRVNDEDFLNLYKNYLKNFQRN